MLYSEIVIAGCGNPLFADDGFGPAVIEEMQKLSLPDNVTIIDAGLGGPHFIFTLLDPEVTKKLIIIDIADFGEKPGTLAKFRVEDLPPGSYQKAHHHRYCGFWREARDVSKVPRGGPASRQLPGRTFVGPGRTAPAHKRSYRYHGRRMPAGVCHRSRDGDRTLG